MTVAQSPSRATLNDRFFDALPFAPFWLAGVGGLVLLGLFLGTVLATGDLGEFLKGDIPWWRDRDGRLAVLLAMLAAYLPVARRYEQLGARRNLELLRGSGSWPPGQLATAARELEIADVGKVRRAGWIGLAILPLAMFLVDSDPAVFVQSAYWGPPQLWTRGLAAVALWNSGALVQAVWTHARGFSRVAAALPEVNLLEPESLSPFARQARLMSLPCVTSLSFLAFNLIDPAMLLIMGVAAAIFVLGTGIALSMIMGSVRERIRRAKRDELEKVNAAIRGETGALAGSSLALRESDPDLAGLLAYRQFVASVPEWPGGVSQRSRVLLYVAIPVGSWLGGALVERLLGAVLG